MCSSAPDMTAQNTAALSSAQNGADALNFYKQIYADNAPARTAAAARANAVSDAQLQAMQAQTAIANDTNDYNKSTFRPLEQGIVSDAENFDTEGKREELAGKALGDVNEQFGAARAAEGRQMARMGINPNDGAYAAEATQRGNAQALAGADAENKSRQQSIVLGHAMKMDAASLGRNLPSNQTSAAQAAIQAGNSSAQNAGLPLSQAAQSAGIVGQGYNTAGQGYGTAGNIYGSANNIQMGVNNSNNQTDAAAGSAIGSLALLALSDKTAKKSIKREAPEVSLAAIKKIPVSRWTYKNGKGDGGRHTGPMAQDVQAALGNGAAPGGKAIDLISMNGHSINAIKAVEKRVVALEHAKVKKRAAA
jgi:hypothetical protein